MKVTDSVTSIHAVGGLITLLLCPGVSQAVPATIETNKMLGHFSPLCPCSVLGFFNIFKYDIVVLLVISLQEFGAVCSFRVWTSLHHYKHLHYKYKNSGWPSSSACFRQRMR